MILICMLVCLRSFVISSDYQVYMDSSMMVDRSGDCYYTCALINWTVLLHWSFMARICLRKGRISSSSVAFSVSLSQRLLGTGTVLLCTSRGATCSPHKTAQPSSSLQNQLGCSGHTRSSSLRGIEFWHPPKYLDLWRPGAVLV